MPAFYLWSLALLLRMAISLHPYSGAGKPPMHGDFEAQRHWMEITYHLPVSEWYYNGTANDLQYWGLDYPPLTAYMSYAFGLVGHHINPEWMALVSSRGFESEGLKTFMRYSVFIMDCLIFFPAVWLAVRVYCRAFSARTTAPSCTPARLSLYLLLSLLLSPSLILIDYGHFQYNGVSLGLALLGVLGILTDRPVLASVAFSLSLNYKQMSLYYALAFFFVLLGRIFKSSSPVGNLIFVGLAVIVTFALCWLPFLSSVEDVKQVLHRLFPFARGLYEDKVANFWCSLSPILKPKTTIPENLQSPLCMALTLLASLPSCIDLFLRPTNRKFLYSLFSCSMAFFLFSYQVHEKSILLPLLALSLLSWHHPVASYWLHFIGAFSLLPLLVKDGLVLAFVCCSIIHFLASYALFPIFLSLPQKIILFLSVIGACVIGLAPLFYTPPAHLPDLLTLLNCIYSFVHFIGFFLYFNYVQIMRCDHVEELASDKMKKFN